MEQLAVYASPLPFAAQRIRTFVPLGSSVQDVVDFVCRDDIKDAVAAVAIVNGIIIEKSEWATTIPSVGDVVNVRVIPAKGSGKTIIMAVVAIAMMVAMPAIGAAIGGALAGGAGTVVFAGITAAEIGSMVGTMVALVATSALMSVAAPSSNVVNNPSESATRFIEGATNSIDPFGVVPICLGTNRIFPKQAARPYTETQDNKQYVRQLFCLGVGKNLSVTDRKIGDTVITEFSGVEMEDRLAGDLNLGTGLYTNDAFQDDYSVLLTYVGGYTTRTAHADSDEAIVDLTFTSGLCSFDSQGSRNQQSVQLEIQYSITGAGSWTTAETKTVTASTAEALRVSSRIVFPANGTYDIRVRRLTADSTSDYIHDEVYLSAIKSFAYTAPVVADNVNGIAMRILGTDQLNGTVDQFNCVVSQIIPDYDSDTGYWLDGITSNPASIYLFVLTGCGNAKPAELSDVILADFEAWHTWCETRGLTYNRVIDYETSVDAVLRDIAAAGCASPANIDGKRSIVVDNVKSDIVQMITPRNSWDYSGKMVYADLPHAIRVQFRNAEKGYQQDERIVYNDGYSESTATLFETYEVASCTNSDLAYKYGRRMFAIAKLRPETHVVSMDIENLVAMRGDRVKLEHDIPLIGVGDARIKFVVLSDDSYQMVQGITIDDTISIPLDSTYYVRIRKADGAYLYKEIVSSVGSFASFDFATPFDISETPEIGDLCYFVEAGEELDCIITKIEPQSDFTAKLTLQDYAPEIFDAETGVIPEFNSHITTPLQLMRPVPPLLLSSQSDETVAVKNADGSILSRAIFTLQNENEPDIQVSVRARKSGDTQFENVNVLEAKPERVIITGLDDGYRYDIHIYYSRVGSSVFSKPLQINSYLYVGVSGNPSDVTGFAASVVGDTEILKWNPSTDIDISGYRIKHSPLLTGATYETAVLFVDSVASTQYVAPFRSGTYFLKAVDFSGNESDNAVYIILTAPEATKNVVETILEESPFTGSFVDCDEVPSGSIEITDLDVTTAYYYFGSEVDLGAVFNSYVSALNDVGAALISGFSGTNDLFAVTDIFAMTDVFGIAAGSWGFKLEISTTSDDPALTSAEWSTWEEFKEGYYNARGYRFRIILYSYERGITPSFNSSTITIDMDDRIERAEGLTVPATGYTVTYPYEFFALPATSIQLQNMQEGDRVEFTSKTVGGFTFKVYNDVSLSYVERTFDYISSGYGRKAV